MAKAYECDRCGKYYSYYAEPEEFFGKKIRLNSVSANFKTEVGSYDSDISVDICPLFSGGIDGQSPST